MNSVERERNRLTHRDLQDHRIVQKQVEQAFSKAAIDYDRFASLQRRVAMDVARQIDFRVGSDTVVVDIGAGTGAIAKFVSVPLGHWINLDLSHSMLSQCVMTAHSVPVTCVQGDAERLPLQDASVDMVVSSMALQWCRSPQQVLSEIYRVLRPSGMAILAIMTRESLGDLRLAWHKASFPARLHSLHPAKIWIDHAHQQFSCEAHHHVYTEQASSIIDMLRRMKRIGAGVYTSAATRLTRNELNAVDMQWCKQHPNHYFLDYHIIQLLLVK